MAQERLRRSELEILQKEEEALKEIIAKYEDELNKLKVEELTIRSELGRAQDKDLQSRNNTPVSTTGNTSRPESTTSVTPVTSSSQVLQTFQSLADRGDMEIISAQPTAGTNTISDSTPSATTDAAINQSTLNLGTAMIHTASQEEEEDSDDENEIFPSYNDLQYKVFQEKINAEKVIPTNKRLNLSIKVEQLEEEGLFENIGKNVGNKVKVKEEPMEQVNNDVRNEDIHVIHDKCSSNYKISDKVTLASDEESNILENDMC